VNAPDRLADGAVLSRPAAVLFDWDNTLIDSWPTIQDAQNHVFRHFGMPTWTLEETRQRVRGSMRDAFPPMFGDRWEEAGEVFYARFAERHLETLTPLPHAETLLEHLSGIGIYLGVVSNKKGDYLRRETAHLGWDRHFGGIVGAFDAARDKPAPDPVDLALADSAIKRGPSVWFVGDADIDITCAENAGCVPVLMRESPPKPGEFQAPGPAMCVPGCEALCNVLRNL